MMNVLKYSLLPSFLVFCGLSQAQQVTQKDTIFGTPLTLTMDSRINAELNNLEERCIIANTKKTIKDNDFSASSNPSRNNTATTKPSTKIFANRALTTAEICRDNPRILGVKIQLAVVKSNEEANEVKSYFRRRFPNIKVETDASLRPNYKILAGSYFNRQSAAGDLAKIRQYFKSALPVQYRVFCQEAK